MTCPRAEEIDLYVEGAVDAVESRRMEEHLAVCPPCGAVRKDHKDFLEAFRGLPDLEIPPDLAGKIMARAFPPRPGPVKALVALAGGLAAFFLGGLVWVLATGGNLTALLLESGKSSWGSAGETSLALVKLVKLAVLTLKLLFQFAGGFAAGVTRLASIFDPGVYAVGLLLVAAITAAGIFGFRRIFENGERP